MLKNFQPRLYQQTILATAINYNTLVVLPTGMGKTFCALMLAAHRLKQYPNLKVLILAPTKPLVEQHKKTFEKHLDIDPVELVVFTGLIRPEKRAELWKGARIVFSTPQGLENDIINKKIDLKDVSLLVFDECHRAIGDYSYVYIAKQYDKVSRFGRILALTASPGSDMEKINEVCQNLLIEEIEARTDKDPDIKPYIQNVKIDWVKVELPESFKQIQTFLQNCYKSKLKEIAKYGYIDHAAVTTMSKTEMLKVQGALQGQLASGNRTFDLMKSVSLMAEAIKVQHALELLETQGIYALNNYLEGLMHKSYRTKIKAIINLSRDINFRSAYIRTKTLAEKKVEHPKLLRLRRLISEELRKNPEAKIIVFNQFRDSITKIYDEIRTLQGVNAAIFVGQTKKNGTGLSQKEQVQIMNDFSTGKYNVVVMSSVGEEGLDIPSVDVVIFYEPVPSAIRTIQRRGRTGRLTGGKVIMLATSDTRDMGYKWSAHHKEKRMYRILEQLKSKYSLKRKPTITTLNDFSSIKMFCDHREKGSAVVKELLEQNVDLRLQQLDVADYLLSSEVAVEYKNSEDFVNSLIDGRLLQQLKKLKQSFEKPIVLVEGKDIYSQRNVHPNAIRGMLATIMVNYSIPVIFTRDAKEGAAFLVSMARREQEKGSAFSLHSNKKSSSLREQQEYIVEALPSVGPDLAKRLLLQFGSVKAIANASVKELKKVEGIGDKIANSLRNVFEEKYQEKCQQ